MTVHLVLLCSQPSSLSGGSIIHLIETSNDGVRVGCNQSGHWHPASRPDSGRRVRRTSSAKCHRFQAQILKRRPIPRFVGLIHGPPTFEDTGDMWRSDYAQCAGSQNRALAKRIPPPSAAAGGVHEPLIALRKVANEWRGDAGR